MQKSTEMLINELKTTDKIESFVTENADEIYILADNEIKISDTYNSEATFSMTLYGYMLQIVNSENELETFEKILGGE